MVEASLPSQMPGGDPPGDDGDGGDDDSDYSGESSDNDSLRLLDYDDVLCSSAAELSEDGYVEESDDVFDPLATRLALLESVLKSTSIRYCAKKVPCLLGGGICSPYTLVYRFKDNWLPVNNHSLPTFLKCAVANSPGVAEDIAEFLCKNKCAPTAQALSLFLESQGQELAEKINHFHGLPYQNGTLTTQGFNSDECSIVTTGRLFDKTALQSKRVKAHQKRHMIMYNNDKEQVQDFCDLMWDGLGSNGLKDYLIVLRGESGTSKSVETSLLTLGAGKLVGAASLKYLRGCKSEDASNIYSGDIQSKRLLISPELTLNKIVDPSILLKHSGEQIFEAKQRRVPLVYQSQNSSVLLLVTNEEEFNFGKKVVNLTGLFRRLIVFEPKHVFSKGAKIDGMLPSEFCKETAEEYMYYLMLTAKARIRKNPGTSVLERLSKSTLDRSHDFLIKMDTIFSWFDRNFEECTTEQPLMFRVVYQRFRVHFRTKDLPKQAKSDPRRYLWKYLKRNTNIRKSFKKNAEGKNILANFRVRSVL